ncbi:hypothetical protein SUGI_0984750 [Cryptomeria japonica]|nr:hypothetical protein SUGI_0984750 [Cryptomeria japonica]
MEESEEKEEMERAVKVALWCIQEDPEARPSMTTVVQVLQGDITLPDPPIPSAFTESGGQTSSSDVSSISRLLLLSKLQICFL